MKKRFGVVSALIVILLIMAMCLSSCGVLAGFLLYDQQYLPEDDNSGDDIIQDDENNSDILGDLGEADEILQSGNNNETDDNKKGDVIQNTIVIEGASSDVAYAASAGLRSSVSVFSKHGTSSIFTGSGVIYELDEENGSAFIITNYHVVYYNGSISNDISIYLFGMQSSNYAIPATYVGGSPYYDIAILHVDNNQIIKDCISSGSLAAVKIADSESVVAGSTAIAIGAPGVSDTTAFSNISVTCGIVSVDSEYITMSEVNGVGDVQFRVVRIDAAVNSGNSGGGLFNAKGELIGIVNIRLKKSDVENIAYAIPANLVNAATKNIIDNCYGKDCKRLMKATMGVTITANKLYTAYDEKTGILKSYEEIIAYGVDEGSLSHGLIKVGDIIKNIKIGDMTIEVKRMYNVIDAMLYARVGDEVVTTVIRDGKEVQIKLTITEACLTEY